MPLYSALLALRRRLGAHYWTIRPLMRYLREAPSVPQSKAWSRTFTDGPDVPTVGGFLHADTNHAALLILVHGLGGCADSHYLRRAAAAGLAAGFDVLRLNLRGADGQGDDFYHGGLSTDLAAVVAAPGLVRYQQIVLLGFSLGGHLVLRYATHVDDPRVVGVAAVCSPLHLGAGQQAIDRRAAWAYRRYVLRGLKAGFERVAPGRGMAASLPAIRSVRTLRAFDRHTVVQRFGFVDPADYYTRASVGTHLASLRVKALLVASRYDPMVPPSAIEPWLDPRAQPNLEVRWQDAGGHVGMPPRMSLGFDSAPSGVEAQTVAWLRAHLGVAVG